MMAKKEEVEKPGSVCTINRTCTIQLNKESLNDVFNTN